MPQLIGVNASHAEDLAVALSLLGAAEEGLCPDRQGWGIAFHDGRAARIYKEAGPVNHNAMLRILRERTFTATSMVGQFGEKGVDESQPGFSQLRPFDRELAGRSWVFAHAGSLPGIGEPVTSRFRALGDSDSERAFVLLLETLSGWSGGGDELDTMLDRFADTVSVINVHGAFNFLLADGEHLFVHAHTSLHVLEIEGERPMRLIASYPSEDARAWACLRPNTLAVFRQGRLLGRRATRGQAPASAWQDDAASFEDMAACRRKATEERARQAALYGEGFQFESC
ncbi:class II glutamine amidotransferase [Labrys sp. KB_33_2]|uniref:class II glutamine amidotransferase n=1 Tax=Labrys sp. KB_33_2 TaxID=3237479 RepID=UPI003F8E5CA2